MDSMDHSTGEVGYVCPFGIFGSGDEVIYKYFGEVYKVSGRSETILCGCVVRSYHLILESVGWDMYFL